jgi:DNA invertase Pin-like site-specific DNA recombinase
MRLVAYLRVSTDDKGQDPQRQRDPILKRSAHDGHEIVAWVVDEKPNGRSSGGIPALQREGFMEAIETARTMKADGIILESVDRLSRVGWQDVGLTTYILEVDYRLSIVFADVRSDGDGALAEILVPLMAYIAKLTRKRLSEATKSGMARKKAAGVRMGRPPKPPLTDDEFQTVLELLRGGTGWRLCAIEVSRLRDAHAVSDAKAARDRKVSARWVKDQVATRSKTLGLLERVPRRAHAPPLQNGPNSPQGGSK